MRYFFNPILPHAQLSCNVLPERLISLGLRKQPIYISRRHPTGFHAK